MAGNDGLACLRLLLPNGVPSSDALIQLLVLLSSYFVINAVYFLILHPLAKIPGPRLSAVTRIPYWLQNINGNDVHWLHNLHTKYGPILRFGPTDVSYATAEAWKDIHGHAKGHGEMEKAPEFSSQPVNGVPNMLTANYENHTRVRRLFSPAFSERALKKQEPLFKKYVDILISKINDLGDSGTQPVEMTKLYNFTSFDIMAELCFGHSLGLLEENNFSPWVSAIFESLKMLPFASMIAYYPILNATFTRFEPKSITRQRVSHCKHSADRVNQRLQEGSKQPDIWNLVVEAQDTESGLSIEEMHSNAELFMLAGSETTATLLSGLTYFLLLNPDKLQLLCNEVRSFKAVEDLSFEKLASLKYLNACLKEGLRIYPPVPIGSPRVIPKNGQTVLGTWLPAETRVSCHHFSTYHSEANFKNADKFAPERWLDDPIYANDTLEAHQPFGWGPRNCLGQSMAMHEMRLIMATVIYTFDLALCRESFDWSKQQAYALWANEPLLCRLKPVPL